MFCQQVQVTRQILQQPSNLHISLHSCMLGPHCQTQMREQSLYLLHPQSLLKPSMGISICGYSYSGNGTSLSTLNPVCLPVVTQGTVFTDTRTAGLPLPKNAADWVYVLRGGDSRKMRIDQAKMPQHYCSCQAVQLDQPNEDPEAKQSGCIITDQSTF